MAIFDITYVGDMPYLKLEGGTVTGATIFNSSVTANSGSITNNLAVGSINGVTVGSSPKFTDTTYSVATTSANGLLPALGGGTTNYLRADGAWAKPPGTTYSVATTSANGLMAAADKVAVNKIGSGTLNTTNKTIIPAINELVTKGNATLFTTTATANATEVLTFDKPVLISIAVTSGMTSNGVGPDLRFPKDQWYLVSADYREGGFDFTDHYSTSINCRRIYGNHSDGFQGWSVYYSTGSSTSGNNGVPTGVYCLAIGLPGKTSYTITKTGSRSITITGHYIPLPLT